MLKVEINIARYADIMRKCAKCWENKINCARKYAESAEIMKWCAKWLESSLKDEEVY